MPSKERRLRETLRAALARCTTLEEVMRAADLVVRPALRAAAITWATVDPATMLHTSCMILGDIGQGQVRFPTDPQRERRLFELEWEDRDPNTFADLFRSGRRAGGLRRRVDDPATVVRFRELLAPAVSDELRVLCMLDGALWGTLVAYRAGPDALPFGEEEEALAESVSELIAVALRRMMLRAACDQPAGAARPGLVVLDAANDIVLRSGSADALLAELDEGQRATLVSLAAGARETGEAGATVATAAGMIRLHASAAQSALSGAEGGVAIIVERPGRLELSEVIVEALGLTGREREIVELLFAGFSRKEIANKRGIEDATVAHHLQSIYRKAGVDGRAALLAKVYSRFYADRRAAGDHPAPYGFFLAPTSVAES